MRVYEENVHEINYRKGKRLLELYELHSLRIYDQGYQSSKFSDFDLITEESSHIETVSNLYIEIIDEIAEKKKIDCLYFLDKEGKSTVGAIKLAGILTYFTGIPNLIIRLDHDVIVKKLKISSILEIKNIETGILIVDHITTGKEVLEGINIVEKCDKKISDVISYTIMSQSFKEKSGIEQKGINVHGIYYRDAENYKI